MIMPYDPPEPYWRDVLAGVSRLLNALFRGPGGSRVTVSAASGFLASRGNAGAAWRARLIERVTGRGHCAAMAAWHQQPRPLLPPE